ncbi:MAG: 5'-nucleotidase C-terminal domain-containing protein, partial [Coriobacteriia bacterium]|nr:5'-nucleotidase C-terminal domain-containing protein [Coriobacteriia bacterium]
HSVFLLPCFGPRFPPQSRLATVYKRAQDTYGADNVVLIDAGDAVQGSSYGSVSQGTIAVDVMNYLGYYAAALGNHEFDYGLAQLKTLAQRATYSYLSCNFTEIATGDTVFAPYVINEYNGKKVAFVGITTPCTLVADCPSTFKDAQGNYLYSFAESENGQALYSVVQKNVDAARAAGADYVIAVGHMGQMGVESAWRSDTLVQNTTGIDAFVDGHSHQVYQQDVKNKNGEVVPITQCGYGLTACGEVIIDLEGADAGITTTQVSFADMPESDLDADTLAKVDEITADVEKQLEQVVAKTSTKLVALESDGTTWAVRRHETNLADLVADAYKEALGCEVGIINGGGIRANIAAGNITLGDLVNVQPFSNSLSSIRVTGQQLADALELSAMNYPMPNGGFLHVSGMTYTINPTIASTVELDDAGNFVKVAGDRRVCDITVNGKPLDLAAQYVIGGLDFILIEGGNGYTMFKGCEVVVAQGLTDLDAVRSYITDKLGGTVGAPYNVLRGEGRITIDFLDVADSSQWYYQPVNESVRVGLFSGYTNDQGLPTGYFGPFDNLTRAQAATVLWRHFCPAAADSYNNDAKNETGMVDVEDNAFYTAAVNWAVKNGAFVGYADADGNSTGYFGVNDMLTCQDLCVVLARLAGGEGDVSKLSALVTDSADISDYAKPACAWALENGVLSGYENDDGTRSLHPTEDLYRARAASILVKALGGTGHAALLLAGGAGGKRPGHMPPPPPPGECGGGGGGGPPPPPPPPPPRHGGSAGGVCGGVRDERCVRTAVHCAAGLHRGRL